MTTAVLCAALYQYKCISQSVEVRHTLIELFPLSDSYRGKVLIGKLFDGIHHEFRFCYEYIGTICVNGNNMKMKKYSEFLSKVEKICVKELFLLDSLRQKK